MTPAEVNQFFESRGLDVRVLIECQMVAGLTEDAERDREVVAAWNNAAPAALP